MQLSTSPSLEGLTEDDLLSLSREAEKRLRPFACGVGDCQRRYKNMNGLRYHYQHSGDHGAIGLALLASGQHECLQHNKSRHSTPSHSASNSISSTNQTNQTPRSPSTAQSSTPAYHQTVPQPFTQPPSYQSAM